MILLDTNMWSLAFRRPVAARSAHDAAQFHRVRELMISGDATLIGPIRQELLSGVKIATQFDDLREWIDAFRLIEMDVSTFDMAAECFNRCRAAGIAADSVDMMICAAAVANDIPVLTADEDFDRYAAALAPRLIVAR